MNTPFASAPSAGHVSGGVWSGIADRLRGAEAWLDRRGRGGWIAAMVLGFIFFWPLGLFLVAYITLTNRWSKTMFASCSHRRHSQDWNRNWHTAKTAGRPSGNSAFDAYKADTLRRLEEEQEAFESFLDRLRAAKDKSEFDAFMEDRAKGVKPAPQGDKEGGEDSPRGEY